MGDPSQIINVIEKPAKKSNLFLLMIAMPSISHSNGIIMIQLYLNYQALQLLNGRFDQARWAAAASSSCCTSSVNELPSGRNAR